jgi:hypothetical protein
MTDKFNTIQDLINAYTYNCFNPMIKILITQLRDKIFVQLATEFMNAKKYKSKNPNATDEYRFNDLVINLVNKIKETNQLTPFIKNGFYDELILFLNMQYYNLEDTFIKGAYPKMIDVLNRIFNPKNIKDDDDDNEDNENIFENLQKYIKTYSPFIENVLTNFKLYHSQHEINKEVDEFYCDEIVNFYKNNYVVFNLYKNEHALWCFQNDSKNDINLIENKLIPLSTSDFIQYIENDTYNMNLTHYTTLETIKRDYISKSFENLKTHLQMIPNLYFYKGEYNNNSDFENLNDLQIRNTIQGFPNGFDDEITKKCLAIFCFNGEKNVELVSYWLTTQPIDILLNKIDNDAFVWTTINSDTFIELIRQETTYGISCLH